MLMKNTNTSTWRKYCIWWLYASSVAHVLVGIALPWLASLSLLEAYHRMLEAGFWTDAAPAAARAQQIWWMSLFGATIQSVGIWMATLTRLGDQHRSSFAWAMLLLGVVVWAPQDMWISHQAGATLHVWVDVFALLSLLPPLVFLFLLDRCATSTNENRQTS